MSRIEKTFAELRRSDGRGFIPFLVAGDPDLESLPGLLEALAMAGATVIEVGVPFSDPMADGPVIQRASERALRREIGLDDILTAISRVSDKIDTPIVLFSYLNPLLQYGFSKLTKRAKAAGIDALLVTDLAHEESESYRELLQADGIDLIPLVAPTTSEARLERIAKSASGFIYAVSRAGVTGVREDLSQEARALVKRVRSFSDLPVAVGFGISTREQVAAVWQYADAAVVGSAIVAEIERCNANDLASHLNVYASSLLPQAQ